MSLRTKRAFFNWADVRCTSDVDDDAEGEGDRKGEGDGEDVVLGGLVDVSDEEVGAGEALVDSAAGVMVSSPEHPASGRSSAAVSKHIRGEKR